MLMHQSYKMKSKYVANTQKVRALKTCCSPFSYKSEISRRNKQVVHAATLANNIQLNGREKTVKCTLKHLNNLKISVGGNSMEKYSKLHNVSFPTYDCTTILYTVIVTFQACDQIPANQIFFKFRQHIQRLHTLLALQLLWLDLNTQSVKSTKADL